MTQRQNRPEYEQLADSIRQWGYELGFDDVGITDTDLMKTGKELEQWLAAGYQGEMDYMARHGEKRYRPERLVPGTMSVISLRMNYLSEQATDPGEVLNNAELGYVSRYALGRDYHKLLRSRLKRLAKQIEDAVGTFGYRLFVDSAPVMEKPLASKAGLGWMGKHSNLLTRGAGSWFFLGELYTDLPLPTDQPVTEHCGRCTACIDLCPTRAIVAPYIVDARLCISYLTIEQGGPIPIELRPLVGNRIYGCDDCQLVCPWNRFAKYTSEQDFLPRHGLDAPQLADLFSWSKETFLSNTEGSPIRRIGHISWLRNIAVALGNAPASAEVVKALQERANHSSPLVREHVEWALGQHNRKRNK